MKKRKPDKWVQKALHWLIPLAVMLAVGVAGEILYHLPIEKSSDYQYLDASQITAEGFKLQDGVYVSTKGGASLVLTFEEQFVDKLYYEFEYDGQLHAVVYAGEYHYTNSSKDRKIADDNNHLQSSSTVNIHRKTDTIKIVMPRDAQHVNIRAVAINNTGNYSMGRFLFHMIAAGIILMLIAVFHNERFWKPERIFLAIAGSVGMLMILTLPAHKVGLDEEIHFGRAYYLFETLSGHDTVTVTPPMNDLITASLNNWPYSIPQSEEEQKKEDDYWNASLSWDSQKPSSEYQQNNYRFQLYSLSYLPQALMIKVGQLFRLDFSAIFRLGRMGNLILYCAVIFLAIRKIPYGKRIMLVMALMPTPMFSAVTYTYDTTVTAFTFLGIAYLIPELLDDGRRINYRNCAVFIASFLIASMPKPVYIPMLLLALFIPGRKFATKKEQYLFKGMIGGAFLLMLSTFALEPLLNANQAGDARGGDTGVGRQLRYVFAHPVAYGKLLLSSIRNHFFDYTLGYEGLALMGHLAGNETTVTTAVLAVSVSLTDKRSGEERDMTKIQKAAALFLCFVTICLIWSALYLSFTPVGADIIRGVQGRYHLPVTILMLLALRTGWIRNGTPKRIDDAVITGCSAAILLTSVYGSVIINTF